MNAKDSLSRLIMPHYDSSKFFLIFLSVFIVLLIDISLSNVADIITDRLISIGGIILYVIISSVCTVGQYYVLGSIRRRNRETSFAWLRTDKVDTAVLVVQSSLTVIMWLVIFQIFFGSSYHTNLLTAAVAISYSLAAILMAILAQRLLSWFLSYKSIVVLLYGLMAATMAVNTIASIILFDVVLLDKPPNTTPQSKVVFEVGFKPGNPMAIVASLQSISLVVFFLLTWGATSLLMRHHMRRIGKIKYWSLVSLPLIYFMSYYLTFYQTLNPNNPFQAGPGLLFPIFAITYAVALCGILFGFGFRSVSKSIDPTSHTKDYMIITAFGIILFFNANDATVLQAPYPPFGLANVAFVGLSTYLIYVGLYYSAISVANDVKLRKSIKQSTIEALKLLDSIGSAHMQKEIEKRVVKTAKSASDLMIEETGIQPSLTEQETKEYIEKVLEEIERTKSRSS